MAKLKFTGDETKIEKKTAGRFSAAVLAAGLALSPGCAKVERPQDARDSMQKIADVCQGSPGCIQKISSELAADACSPSNPKSKWFDESNHKTEIFTAKAGDALIWRFPSEDDINTSKVLRVDENGIDLEGGLRLEFGQEKIMEKYLLSVAFNAYKGENGAALIELTYSTRVPRWLF